MLENGLNALNKGKLDKALSIFEEILKEDPKNTIAWNNKGVTLRKLGKLDEAIDCYNIVLGIDPKQIQALLNKAPEINPRIAPATIPNIAPIPRPARLSSE